MKRICKYMVIAAIVAAMGTIVYSTQSKKASLSDLAIENIEALALSGESGNFDCIPPYDKYTCVYMGSTRIPGIKYNR